MKDEKARFRFFKLFTIDAKKPRIFPDRWYETPLLPFDLEPKQI